MPTAVRTLVESGTDDLREYILRTRRNLIKYENRQAAKLLKAFNAAEDTIQAQLAKLASKVNEWTHGELVANRRLEKLITGVQREIAALTARAGDITGTAMRRAYLGGFSEAAEALALVGLDTTGSTLSVGQIKAAANLPIIGAPYGDRYRNLSKYMQRRVREELTQSVILGEGMDAAARRLNRIVKGGARTANTIARTGIMTANNVAATMQYQRYSDQLAGVIRDETLDSRTCAECGAHDGDLIPLDQPFPCPAHYQCRGVAVPKVKGETLGPRRAKAGDGSTTMVPGDTVWRDWITKQPKGVLEDVFGKGKGGLLHTGRLELDELYSDGRVIPVGEANARAVLKAHPELAERGITIGILKDKRHAKRVVNYGRTVDEVKALGKDGLAATIGQAAKSDKMYRKPYHLRTHKDEFGVTTPEEYIAELRKIASNPDTILAGWYTNRSPHHLQLYFVQHRPEGRYVAAWEVAEGQFASGWREVPVGYEGWRDGKLLYTLDEKIGEATMSATGGEFSLRGWLRFGELHLEEADTTEILLYRRYAVEKSGLPSEHIEAADQDVLKRFYSYERTPEFEEQLSEAFEYSRGLPPYCDYWFFNLDKIILGEWSLEKVPEHLRDIVKEARGE